MLKLGHVEAEVALFPMLFGDIKINRLIMEDLDLLVETNAEGVGYWEFGERKDAEQHDEDEEYGGDGGALPVIDEMRIDNALMRFQDGESGERQMLMISHAQGQSQEAEDVTFVLEGIWNNSLINASGSIGAGEKNVPVTLLIEMFGAKTNIDGTVQDPKEFKRVDLDIRVAGEKLSDLNMVAGSFPPIGPYTLAANLRDSGKDTYTLDNFQAHIAESGLTGTLTFEKAERPRLTADLTSTLLDLDALLTKPENAATKEAESDASGGTTQGAGEAGETERLFPDAPLDLSSLNKADADVSLKVAELRYGGLALRDAVVGMNLECGMLQITPLQAGLAKGVVDGESRLDSRANPAKLQLAMNVTEVDLAAIKPMFDLSEVVSGPLDLDISLTGQGRSPHEIAASLDGRVGMEVGAGTVPNEYVDLIAVDLLRFMVPDSKQQDGARLNCFVARFAVKDGEAVNQALLFDTALTTTAGKGQINLGREVADLTIVPRPKDSALCSLPIPILVDGPLTNLSYSLKKEEALLGLAGSVLGTVLLGPFGVLIPFVSAGSGDDNPCASALDNPQENPQPTNQTPASPTDAVEDAVENLLGIFD